MADAPSVRCVPVPPPRPNQRTTFRPLLGAFLLLMTHAAAPHASPHLPLMPQHAEKRPAESANMSPPKRLNVGEEEAKTPEHWEMEEDAAGEQKTARVWRSPTMRRWTLRRKKRRRNHQAVPRPTNCWHSWQQRRGGGKRTERSWMMRRSRGRTCLSSGRARPSLSLACRRPYTTTHMLLLLLHVLLLLLHILLHVLLLHVHLLLVMTTISMYPQRSKGPPARAISLLSHTPPSTPAPPPTTTTTPHNPNLTISLQLPPPYIPAPMSTQKIKMPTWRPGVNARFSPTHRHRPHQSVAISTHTTTVTPTHHHNHPSKSQPSIYYYPYTTAATTCNTAATTHTTCS